MVLPLPQVFYHYNVVQQLKSLYDELLRPETVPEELSHEPSTKMDKGGKKVRPWPSWPLAECQDNTKLD